MGGSYQDETDYSQYVPYVVTDNFKLIKRTYDHLIEAGLRCCSGVVNRLAAQPDQAYSQ